jgi:hypothetical protein
LKREAKNETIDDAALLSTCLSSTKVSGHAFNVKEQQEEQ